MYHVDNNFRLGENGWNFIDTVRRKTMREEEILLVSSNFSSSLNVFINYYSTNFRLLSMKNQVPCTKNKWDFTMYCEKKKKEIKWGKKKGQNYLFLRIKIKRTHQNQALFVYTSMLYTELYPKLTQKHQTNKPSSVKRGLPLPHNPDFEWP